MASQSLLSWNRDSAQELVEIVAAHVAVGGSGRGRRFATVQINHAYAVMLSSQFQRFCRNLHTESADRISRAVAQPTINSMLRRRLIENRKLDVGNPNPGNLGGDFGRFEIAFWPAVLAHDPRNLVRQRKLEHLNNWRNAIAHQHFDPAALGGRTRLSLAGVTDWRAACDGLVVSFDQVMCSHLAAMLGAPPW